MKALGRLAAVALMVAGLTSCVDIEMRFVFHRDGKGYLEIAYHVAPEATTLIDAGDGSPAVPLPIARSDFEAALSGANGVRLRYFRRSDDEEDGVNITAQIAFDSVESLRTIAGLADLPASFLSDGDGGGKLSQRVIPARVSEKMPSQAMVDMLQALVRDHKISFVVVAPVDIKEAEVAIIDADRRTARFSRSLADYLTQRGPVDIAVRW